MEGVESFDSERGNVCKTATECLTKNKLRKKTCTELLNVLNCMLTYILLIYILHFYFDLKKVIIQYWEENTNCINCKTSRTHWDLLRIYKYDTYIPVVNVCESASFVIQKTATGVWWACERSHWKLSLCSQTKSLNQIQLPGGRQATVEGWNKTRCRIISHVCKRFSILFGDTLLTGNQCFWYHGCKIRNNLNSQ